MTPKHPTSNIAFFEKDDNDMIRYLGVRQDKLVKTPLDSKDLFKVYQAAANGDSGGPVVYQIMHPDVKTGTDEKRHVIVGIITNSYSEDSCSEPKQMTTCVQQMTKVTEEIVTWIISSLDDESSSSSHPA